MSQTQKSIGRETTTSITESIVEAVAELDDVDPVELAPPLYEVIDPEALNKLMTHNRMIGKVVFTYNGCEIRVFPDGYVSVEKRGE